MPRNEPAARLTAEEHALVERTIAELRRLYVQGYLATVVAVGDHLIQAFFGGSLELASSHSPTKPVALSRLLERASELPISAYLLRLSPRIASQYHQLHPTVADALSVTHHELLLRVLDAGPRLQLAERAAEEGLSKRALERLVRKIQPRHPGGRPAAPPPLTWARALARLVDDAKEQAAFEGHCLGQLDHATLLPVEKALQDAADEVARMLDACRRRMRAAAQGK